MQDARSFQDARYFRDQGTLCLEMARQVSDRQMAEGLRKEAAQYFVRAKELDTELKAVTAASLPRGDGTK